MGFPEDLRYTKEHEWARIEDDDTVRVGVTDYAQEKLGDIVFVEVPKEGDVVKKDEAFGVIESTKTASDLFSPASGSVLEVNEILLDAPEIINDDPYDEGWIIRIQVEDLSELDELMDNKEYEEYVNELEEEEEE